MYVFILLCMCVFILLVLRRLRYGRPLMVSTTDLLHTCMHIYVYAHIYIYTYAHMYIYIHICIYSFGAALLARLALFDGIPNTCVSCVCVYLCVCVCV